MLNFDAKHSKVSKLNQTLFKENEDLKRQLGELEQRLKKRTHEFESE